MQPVHLSLFSGIGGFDLAAEWAGFNTIACVEKDPFCRKILTEVFPDAAIFSHIQRFGIDRLRKECDFDSIDLITGGFPCQPFSVAGKKKGASDDRHLWPEMFRVIRECEPTWICGENVANLTNMVEFESICLDLEKEGYEVQPIVVPAAGVGAPHLRSRVFVLAYSEHRRRKTWGAPGGRQEGNAPKRSSSSRRKKSMADTDSTREQQQESDREEIRERISYSREDLAYPAIDRIEKRIRRSKVQAKYRSLKCTGTNWQDARQWTVEPKVGRVANGIPSRVDSLRTLGNAVVPQQAYPLLAEIYTQIMLHTQ